jgi:ectoine hydroxylase-related dioxygenase (phytanoyl-CoA dioxygenase family)
MKSEVFLMSNSTPTSDSVTSVVTPAHREQFEREGYFLLEGVVPPEHLQLLRDKVLENIQRIDADMEARGVEQSGINHKGSRYFVSPYIHGEKELGDFIFSDLMAEVTRAALGDDVFLFYEQYVVKAAEKGGKFSWHQDSGYVGHPNHKPYLTCWVTLDDVSEENGTVYLLPYDRAGTRDFVRHRRDEESGDNVGYFGDDPGLPIIAPAGSIACFSSTVFHRSGPNTTDKMRRVYLPQYSAEPLMNEDGSKLWNMAEPFIQNGERVRFGK